MYNIDIIIFNTLYIYLNIDYKFIGNIFEKYIKNT